MKENSAEYSTHEYRPSASRGRRLTHPAGHHHLEEPAMHQLTIATDTASSTTTTRRNMR